MRLETGIVVDGRVARDTDFVIRDPLVMWKSGELGTRARTGPANVVLGHWTAGPPHAGPVAGPRVVRNMKARKRDDGVTPLDVGIHFVISVDGLVWQTCDIAIATVHVGSRQIIRRSIGVECCWPGTVKQGERLGVHGRALRRTVAGDRLDVLEMPALMISAWIRLANALAEIKDGVAIPRQVPIDVDGSIQRNRFTRPQERKWIGGMEHFHVASTTKVDAAGVLVDALRDNGWKGVVV